MGGTLSVLSPPDSIAKVAFSYLLNQPPLSKAHHTQGTQVQKKSAVGTGGGAGGVTIMENRSLACPNDGMHHFPSCQLSSPILVITNGNILCWFADTALFQAR